MSSRKHILVVLMDTGHDTEEWTRWNIDHARDMVTTTPGFLAARTYKVRPDYATIHPESLATRPPYDLVNYYELDERGLEYVLNRKPELGEGPGGGSRPFPAPLGPHLGDGYLLEAVCEEFTPPGSELEGDHDE